MKPGRCGTMTHDYKRHGTSIAVGCGEEGVSVSHERIYQHVYEDKRRGGDLHRHLRCQKPRRKRYGHYDRRGQIRERVPIDERPEVVEARSRIGDWEADTVIGKLGGAVLVTLVERRSRLSLIALAPNKTAKAVKAAILKVLQPLSAQVHTLTYDNGKEFAYHMEIAKVLKANGYFAHPYHSWERGLNETSSGSLDKNYGRDFVESSWAMPRTTLTNQSYYLIHPLH